ncbi:hypothetical protein [Candidatus Uabimicrobium sp. HlEnr_7]|uniref:hypothetical protein n=1 Tax=Candidatus Uabimicrobium helgolandensis TaxID=3095367 RepID=UPI003558A1C1
MAILNWQTIARQKLDKIYQTDLYPLATEDILVAVLPEPEKLGEKVDEEQLQLMEDIRSLLLTKSEDHTEEISLSENTDVIIFERTKIIDRFSTNRTLFSVWLNSQAPLPSKNKIAFVCTKVFNWEYIIEDLTSNDNYDLSAIFKIKVSLNKDYDIHLVENWLRRQDIIHLCEINEIFDMYLTNINFDCIIGSHDGEEVLENLIVQRKLQKKLNHSLYFFHKYGINLEISQIKWETKQLENRPESLTAKIEKNRKESPLDDMRYDRLQIGDIMNENQFDEQLEILAKQRSNKDEMISQITSTRRINKRSKGFEKK